MAGFRFAILIVATLSLMLVLSNILILNFTVICMTASSNQTATNTSSSDAEFQWSSTQRSTLFSAVSWGALAAILPNTWLLHRFGERRVFFVLGALSAASTALSPRAARAGIGWLAACRVLQGAALGACFPVIAAVTANWAPLGENGLFVGLQSAYMQVAPVFTMPLAGFLCESSFGWPAVFYVHAAVCAAVFAAWLAIYRDSPGAHPWMADDELEKVRAGKANAEKRQDETIPWSAIVRSPAVWAVLVAAVGNMFAIELVVLYAPTYLSSVFKLEVAQTGVAAALPTLVQFGVKLLAGWSSDRVGCCGETAKVRAYNSVALFGMALFLAALGFVPDERGGLALLLLVCAASVLGFNSGGFYKSATLVARQFSPLVMSAIQLIMCSAILAVPYVVAALVHADTQRAWRAVFLPHAALLVLAGLAFLLCGSSHAAPWTQPSSVDVPLK